MDESATVAIVAVAAVALFWFVKRQEAQTAMLLAQINARKSAAQSGPYALTVGQVVAVVGTAAATYAGGPSAGVAAANALAPR